MLGLYIWTRYRAHLNPGQWFPICMGNLPTYVIDCLGFAVKPLLLFLGKSGTRCNVSSNGPIVGHDFNSKFILEFKPLIWHAWRCSVYYLKFFFFFSETHKSYLLFQALILGPFGWVDFREVVATFGLRKKKKKLNGGFRHSLSLSLSLYIYIYMYI